MNSPFPESASKSPIREPPERLNSHIDDDDEDISASPTPSSGGIPSTKDLLA
jgi:hypothetical protein